MNRAMRLGHRIFASLIPRSLRSLAAHTYSAKIGTLGAFIFLLLLLPLPVLAFYGDGEMSAGNGLGAALLDFTLRDAVGAVTTTLFNELGVVPGPDWYIEPLEIRKEGGLDFDYEAWFDKTGGDDALCDELQLKARQDSVLVYSGSLVAFTYDAGVISGGSDDWSFELLFENEDQALENLSCQFDFVFRGEQIGGAGYYDEERVSNVFATGEWGVQPGDVVINEVMWMGSTESSHDEWIELRNTTDHEIDVGQWEIENARESGDPALMIPASQTIPANGYLLIAHYPETSANSALNVTVDVVNASISLANSGNGNLVLRDSGGNIIDEAKGDSWPEGDNGSPEKKSMERNDTPGDGTLAGSWHACEDDDGVGSDCNDGTFWDTADGDDYGTPGAANLSENDPTMCSVGEAGEENSGEGQEEGTDSDAVDVVEENIEDSSEGAAGGEEQEGADTVGGGDDSEEGKLEDDEEEDPVKSADPEKSDDLGTGADHGAGEVEEASSDE